MASSLGIGDADEGAFTLTAAVHGPAGEVVAGLGIAGPMNRFDTSIERRYRVLVRGAADAVAERLRAASEAASGPASEAADPEPT